MTSVLNSDFRDIDAPLTLIAGELAEITHDFILHIANNYKCIVIGNSATFSNLSTVLHVSINAKETIRDLKDTLRFAVFFIVTEKDKEIFETLLPKIERDKTRTLVLYPVSNWKDYADSILASKHIPSIFYGIIGEVFGNTIAPSGSEMSRFVHTAVTQREIVFTGDDLHPIFPVAQQDLISELKRIVFSNEKTSRSYLFWYEHPQTIISAAHLLQEVIPDIDIVYDKKRSVASSLTSQSQLIQDFYAKTHFTPVYMEAARGFKKSIAEITFPKAKKQKIRQRRSSPMIQKSPSGSTSIVFNALIIGFLLFLILNVFLTLAGVFQAKQALKAFSKGEYSRSLTSLRSSRALLQLSEPVITALLTTADALKVPQLQNSYSAFASGLSIMSNALVTIDGLQALEKGLSFADFQKTVANAQYLYFSTQNSPLREEISQLAWFHNPNFTNLLTISPVLPEVLGYTAPKQYLLLFQNNGELRPTGGFIGSIGELTIKNGRVEEIKIRDVYELDGQLKQHVEPPFIVRRYLQPHLYLRDSNFSPDFQLAASSAAQLYKLETGKKVDGVIGIDFTVLQQMIDAVGPLHLPNYNKTIDKQNSFSFIQSTIDDNFFPGSTGKRDILNEIFTQLQLALNVPDNKIKALRLLPELLRNKHIQIALQDSTTQEVFSVNRFGGSLRDKREENSEQINDFLSINEANIGVNKANIALPERYVSYGVSMKKNQLLSHVTIRYDNTAGNAKKYFAYLRFMVPNGIVVDNVWINEEKQKTREAITDARIYESKSFQEPKELEISTETVDSKTMFGFPVTITQGRQTTITVDYHKEMNLPAKSFDYSLLYIPQAGISTTHLTNQIEFPTDFRPETSIPATYSTNKLTVSQDVQTDTEVRVRFLKK